MFTESLVESVQYSGRRSVYAKLTSTLLQCLVLTALLSIPLLHLERLQITPPLPSVRMTRVPAPAQAQNHPAVRSYRNAPIIREEIVQPPSIPSTIQRIRDAARQSDVTPESFVPRCMGNCGSGLPVVNILSAGPVLVNPPRAPSRPPRVSSMQLGDLIRKVLPEYPIAAKQLGIQGQVVLTALVGTDGRVEHVQLVSGPPLLVRPAIQAVEQWQYRPYLLNREPIEVQTQITVNFVLGR